MLQSERVGQLGVAWIAEEAAAAEQCDRRIILGEAGLGEDGPRARPI
jgi:hypothetical protein